MLHRFLLGITFAAFLATGAASASTSLHLGSATDGELPQFELLSSDADGVHLIFNLPVLEVEAYNLDGEIFHTVAIPGGQLHGELGEPSLPAFTRLVAIPNRSGVTLRVVSVEEETFDGFRLLPMQDDEGDAFRHNREVYRQNDFLGGETVTIGDPQLMRDLRVVPLTFRPVSFNPVTGDIRVTRRVEVELVFAGMDLRSTCERERVPTTPGFRHLFESAVINYGYEEDHPEDAPHLGTWVCIARDNASVLSRLQPLLEWRQRMGYNAMLVDTDEIGSSNPGTIANWLENAYETWEYPPEYVVIVGDCSGSFPIGTFHESYSGWYGEGDHPFIDFTGDQLMPDAFIGRLSAESYNSIELIVNKIVGYESTPDISDANWFGRACLVGDPDDSGLTCIHIQQWVKERLRILGYTHIDTVFTYPFVTQIRNSLNQGATYFGYRGYWGMSGWGNGNISALQNGWKMVYAINLTCGTGSFEGGTSTNEAWLRAGVPPSTPTAGIGAIATATIGTHTRFNNCFYGGAAYGMFWQDHYQMGVSHARGKLEMFLNYAEVQYSQAGRYIHWNNLMGDPATEIWTGYPEPLNVSHPSTVSVGTSVVTVTVVDDGAQPVADAWVHLFKDGQITTGAYTDASGRVELPVNAQSTGTVLVTVTGHNLYPYQGSFTISQQDHFVGVGNYDIDDDDTAPSDGNGNGIINPGERIELGIHLSNLGSQDAEDVTLEVSCDDPNVGLITSGPISYGTIPAGNTVPPPSPIIFNLYHGCPNGHEIRLDLTVESGLHSWPSIVELPVVAPDLAYYDIWFTGCGEQLDPGESGEMVVTLENVSDVWAGGPIDVLLISDSYSVQVTDHYGLINGSIGPGGHNGNWADYFGVSSPTDCIPGQLANLRIVATFVDGVTDTVAFVMQVGDADSHDPTGPDNYGYLAYDHTDTGYEEAPTYSWIDINPYNGGPGQSVGLSDYGYDQDDSETVDLPFSFTFYGQTFDQATICSNGWMAMGSTYLANRRNWYMPSGGGPANMLAPFWDNLYQNGNNRVFHWYDESNHRYVVAWDRLRNHAGSAYESFEIILYDPEYYPTLTGDGVFVFQFEDVTNSDSQQMYSTVGIQNEDHTDGLTFNYFNRRPATAASLADGLAIKFTTGGPGAAEAHSGGSSGPPVFLLLQNQPNPCRDGTAIRFTLDRARPVSLRIFDVDGHLVRTLLQETMGAGAHAASWLGRDDRGLPLPAGVYFYELDSIERSASRKLLLLR
jgi:hypothetical protein